MENEEINVSKDDIEVCLKSAKEHLKSAASLFFFFHGLSEADPQASV